MKFLCSNCGSKYQIADEKVSGRVLRMKCRKCSHDIVIDGQNPTGPSVRPPTGPAPAGAPQGPGVRLPTRAPATTESIGRRTSGGLPAHRSATGVPAAPVAPPRPAAASPLGAGFRRHMSSHPVAGAAPPPNRADALDQWHVAVNDVPVGPLGRQEILRKMSANAVHENSLVWREGFDDWRPLRDVPELASLLRQATPSRPAPPPIAKGSAVPARPNPPSRQVGSRPMPHPHRAGDGLRASARSNVVPMPIGGRMGAAAAPAMDAPMDSAEPSFFPQPGDPMLHAGDLVGTATQDARGGTATGQVFPSQPPGAPSGHVSVGSVSQPMPIIVRRGLPVGAWIAICGSVAFGVVLAAIVGAKIMGGSETPPPTQQVAAPVTQAPPSTTPQAEGNVVDPNDVEIQPSTTSKGGTTGKRGSKATQAKQPELTEEEKKRLAAMSGDTGTQFDRFKGGDVGGLKDRNTASTGSLDAQQISTVVNRNRPGLRQCYERAARGVAAVPNLRVDVTLTIGGSGRVTQVTTAGADLPGLGACMEGAVKRWVFPNAGETTATKFPVVFSAGG